MENVSDAKEPIELILICIASKFFKCLTLKTTKFLGVVIVAFAEPKLLARNLNRTIQPSHGKMLLLTTKLNEHWHTTCTSVKFRLWIGTARLSRSLAVKALQKMQLLKVGIQLNSTIQKKSSISTHFSASRKTSHFLTKPPTL